MQEHYRIGHTDYSDPGESLEPAKKRTFLLRQETCKFQESSGLTEGCLALCIDNILVLPNIGKETIISLPICIKIKIKHFLVNVPKLPRVPK